MLLRFELEAFNFLKESLIGMEGEPRRENPVCRKSYTTSFVFLRAIAYYLSV